jgi:hypothetical protein
VWISKAAKGRNGNDRAVLPTVFGDDEALDLNGTTRVLDYLMDAGVSGVCVLARYWQLLPTGIVSG